MRSFPYTKDGMKQILDSPHKGFNRKCVLLTDGNVWDNAYCSGFIRRKSETMNGSLHLPEWVPGYLRQYDINLMRPPEQVRKVLAEPRLEEMEGLVLMHVYSQGWVIYQRDGRKNRVISVLADRGMPKAWPLLSWITGALEEESPEA